MRQLGVLRKVLLTLSYGPEASGAPQGKPYCAPLLLCRLHNPFAQCQKHRHHHMVAPLTSACMPLRCRAKQAQVQANSTAQSFSKDASQKTKQAGQRAQNAVPQANGRK